MEPILQFLVILALVFQRAFLLYAILSFKSIFDVTQIYSVLKPPPSSRFLETGFKYCGHKIIDLNKA
jgi:hypothetical protein